jgi:preprotein translocase subunit SecF
VIDFMGKRKWFFIASGILTLLCIIFILPVGPFGLVWGVEFTSGSSLTVTFDSENVTQSELLAELTGLGHSEAVVQKTEGNEFIIRLNTLKESVQDPATGQTVSELELIRTTLEQKFGTLDIPSSYDISPSLSTAVARNAIIAVIIASIAMIIYIAFAFRKLVHSVRYGVCAVIGLLHDVIVVLGLYAVLGNAFSLEVNMMFIAGILTVIGYSINNTIIVFDRIRENYLKNPGAPIEEIFNRGITETLGRNINTSLLVLLVCFALLALGGETVRDFMIILTVGVIVGTYSSIAIASALLIEWEKGALGRILGRLNPRRALARGG